MAADAARSETAPPADAAGRSAELSDDAVCAAACTFLHPLSRDRLARLVHIGPPHKLWASMVDGRLERIPRLADLVAKGRDPARLLASARGVDLDELRRRLTEAAVQVVWTGGPGYPPPLLTDPEPPAVLFARGALSTIKGQAVAVVGTRNATSAGRAVATALGRELAAAGVHVVSGLARGIDGAAHRGALAVDAPAGPIGVVASGLDHIYPPEHRHLWHHVAERGVLLSEAPPGTPPTGEAFPARNRILAGLADVVVVVESRYRGGSLITARLAEERGIPVMAVPGSVVSRASEGTNLLIRDGAAPVLDAGDILVALGLAQPTEVGTRKERRPVPERDDRVLLDLLGGDVLNLDSIALRTGRSLAEVALALGRLEAGGWVVRTGGWFERVAEGVS